MTDELEVEVIQEHKEKNHFDDVTTEQYIRYCIFEEYIKSELRGEASIRLMDQIYEWIWDQKVPRDPKTKPSVALVSQENK